MLELLDDFALPLQQILDLLVNAVVEPRHGVVGVQTAFYWVASAFLPRPTQIRQAIWLYPPKRFSGIHCLEEFTAGAKISRQVL